MIKQIILLTTLLVSLPSVAASDDKPTIKLGVSYYKEGLQRIDADLTKKTRNTETYTKLLEEKIWTCNELVKLLEREKASLKKQLDIYK